jgi:hypothetical protein
MSGNYAVRSCELTVNEQANINFIRDLNIRLDFDQHPGGRYFLTQSDVKADFSVLEKKSLGTLGERTVFYSDYLPDTPLPATFYERKEQLVAADYQFPASGNGANGTYALGNTPYIEAGAGIGNIFKFMRVDGIRRFNYLDHPGASRYGIKLSFTPHL